MGIPIWPICRRGIRKTRPTAFSNQVLFECLGLYGLEIGVGQNPKGHMLPFNVLAGYCRDPRAPYTSEELTWFEQLSSTGIIRSWFARLHSVFISRYLRVFSGPDDKDGIG